MTRALSSLPVSPFISSASIDPRFLAATANRRRETDGGRTDDGQTLSRSLARPSRRRRHRPLRVGHGEGGGGGGGGMVAVLFLDNNDVGLARPLDKVRR